MQRKYKVIGDNANPYLDFNHPMVIPGNKDFADDYANTNVELALCSVPYDPGLVKVGQREVYGLGNVAMFDSVSARDNWLENRFTNGVRLESKVGKLGDLKSNFAADAEILLPMPKNRVIGFNYLRVRFVDMPDEGGDFIRDYFYFMRIVSDSVAVNTTKVLLILDSWNTFIYHTPIKALKLKRGHYPIANSSVDDYLADPINNSGLLLAGDVNFQPDEYANVVSGWRHSMANSSGDSLFACVVCSVDFTSDALADFTVSLNGSLLNGLPQDALWGFRAGDNCANLASFVAMIANDFPHLVDSFKGIFLLDEKFLKTANGNSVDDQADWFDFNGFSMVRLATVNNFVDCMLSKEDFNYPPEYAHLAKLYTSPYAVLRVTNFLGEGFSLAIENTGVGFGGDTTISTVENAVRFITGFTSIGSATAMRRIGYNNLPGADTFIGDKRSMYMLNERIPLFYITVNSGDFDKSRNRYVYDQMALEARTLYGNSVAAANTELANEQARIAAELANALNSANANRDNALDAAVKDKANDANQAITARDNALAAAGTNLANALRSAEANRTAGINSANANLASTSAIAAAKRDNTINSANANMQVANITANELYAAQDIGIYTNNENYRFDNIYNQREVDITLDDLNTKYSFGEEAAREKKDYGNFVMLDTVNAEKEAREMEVAATNLFTQQSVYSSVTNMLTSGWNFGYTGEPSLGGVVASGILGSSGGLALAASGFGFSSPVNRQISFNNTTSAIAIGLDARRAEIMKNQNDFVYERDWFWNYMYRTHEANQTYDRFNNHDDLARNMRDLNNEVLRRETNNKVPAMLSKQQTVTGADIANANRLYAAEVGAADTVAGADIANANASYNAAASNANANYATDSANANRSYGTAVDNANREYDTAVGIANRLRDANIANANRAATAGLENAGRKNATDLQIAQASLDASLANIEAAKNTAAMKPAATSYPNNREPWDMRPVGWKLSVERQCDTAIQQTGDYFLRWGYALNKYIPFTGFNLMSRFTYWECEEVVFDNNSIADAYLDSVRMLLLGGVTVWRNPDYIYTTTIYDNR